jgi:hypothetical protein
MIGINVGVPAPMALLSFFGWNRSFCGAQQVRSVEAIMSYRRQKPQTAFVNLGYRGHSVGTGMEIQAATSGEEFKAVNQSASGHLKSEQRVKRE